MTGLGAVAFQGSVISCAFPKKLASGAVVACRRCVGCLLVNRNDKVGRMCAEASTADATWFTTQTYADDVGQLSEDQRPHVDPMALAVGSNLILYSQFKAFVDRLAKVGLRRAKGDNRPPFSVRYAVVGERGDTNDRVHFHGLLFFKGKPPEIDGFDRNLSWPLWPYGFTRVTEFQPRNAKYIAKYILPESSVSLGTNEGKTREKKWQMSKLPPIGAEFFSKLARQLVAQGLAPQDFTYQVPGVTRAMVSSKQNAWRAANRADEAGERLRDLQDLLTFRVHGRSRALFVESFFDEWARVRPGQVLPASPALERYVLGRDLGAREADLAKRAADRGLIVPGSLSERAMRSISPRAESPW